MNDQTVAEGLDREEMSREAIRERDETLNLPGEGPREGAKDLILAIKRLKIEGGTTLPAKIDLALELLR